MRRRHINTEISCSGACQSVQQKHAAAQPAEWLSQLETVTLYGLINVRKSNYYELVMVMTLGDLAPATGLLPSQEPRKHFSLKKLPKSHHYVVFLPSLLYDFIAAQLCRQNRSEQSTATWSQLLCGKRRWSRKLVSVFPPASVGLKRKSKLQTTGTTGVKKSTEIDAVHNDNAVSYLAVWLKVSFYVFNGRRRWQATHEHLFGPRHHLTRQQSMVTLISGHANHILTDDDVTAKNRKGYI